MEKEKGKKMIVKKLRARNNWSQEQLAQITGLSLRTIQRVEAGNKASIETLKSLASVFEVDISKLTEVVILIDKESQQWKSEPWWIKFSLLGIKKRSYMIKIEYLMIAIGCISLTLFDGMEMTAIVAFFGAYTNAKLLAYVDNRRLW
ncbi:helix-turn-helix domain-containing protein [Thalassotalea atypica]|uniref:helix-turn-helix domain-containing protein n=1 Tax=Thalassotalea atypica TaxID=2054316 RepID=UPI002573C326|nr:helix-turn-helix transcriptional regulator [Thalassotalea atypica]